MGVGLIALGLLVAGYGIAGSLGPSQCGTFVDVHHADGESSLPRVQFNDLAERERQLFEKALESDGMARLPTDEPLPPAFGRPRIIVYQGEQYRSGAVSNDGCVSPIDGIKEIPVAGGSLLLLAGIYSTVRTRRE